MKSTKPTENTAENGNKSKPLLAVVLSTNFELFGKLLEYKKDDIVVWKGNRPAILRILCDFKVDFRAHILECAKSTIIDRYNSLHYSNLRLATDEEKESLGDLDILIL